MSNNPPEPNEATDDKSFADILNEFEIASHKTPGNPSSLPSKARAEANLQNGVPCVERWLVYLVTMSLSTMEQSLKG